MKPDNVPIPFNRPLFLEAGIENARSAFRNGRISGDGEFTRRCQAALESHLGSGKVLLTTSCTDALELSALLLDIRPGDEIVLPAYTFVSTANAFLLRGARPVFADVRPDTCNLDENTLAGLVTPRTRAIVVVHYGGIACEMDAISGLASTRGAVVIEDNAHGLFGTYRGRPLGTSGGLAALSFHETKNLSCGEGGAIVINNRGWSDRAEILRDKGTDRGRMSRGEAESYTWKDVGSSFLPSDILAAILWSQLEIREKIQNRRRSIHERYMAGLAGWSRSIGAQLPVVPGHCGPSYHLFHLLLPTATGRDALIRHLQARQIQAVSHYQALNLTPMGVAAGGRPGQCPIAESIASRLVRLPFYFDLSDADQDRVIAAVGSFAGEEA